MLSNSHIAYNHYKLSVIYSIFRYSSRYSFSYLARWIEWIQKLLTALHHFHFVLHVYRQFSDNLTNVFLLYIDRGPSQVLRRNFYYYFMRCSSSSSRMFLLNIISVPFIMIIICNRRNP